MAKDQVDVENLTVTGTQPAADSVTVSDDVLVIINQAYGPTGEKLVGIRDVQFDGFPAVTLKVRAGDVEGEVHLSPIHGDRRKQGLDLDPGTQCELLCPESGKPLDLIGTVIDGEDAQYYALYLSPALDKRSAVYVSNVWGHYHSRIVDNDDLISAWSAAEGE